MKQILIINGSGGVGKDTFVKCLNNIIPTKHISIAEFTKKAANQAGWSGTKSEKDRKFLSDIKLLIDNYNDANFKTVEEHIKNFLNYENPCEVLCIDMRERKDINRLKQNYIQKCDIRTVLVTRKSVKEIKSNIADANVFEISYDYYIENDGTLEQLQEKAECLVKILKTKDPIEVETKKKVKSFDKFIYISHPYNGLEKNKRSVENLILNLITKYPQYMFVSPIHSFGFAYQKLPYDKGIEECLWLLDKCDEMWLCGDYLKSDGCNIEKKYCEANNIPVSIYSEV